VDSLEARESTLEGVFMVVMCGSACNVQWKSKSSFAFTFTCTRIDGDVISVMSASILPYLIRWNAIRVRLWSILVLLSADEQLVASLLVENN